MDIVRPEDIMSITTGYGTFKHLHDDKERPRDYSKVGNQRKEGFKRDTVTGVTTSQHEITSMKVQYVGSDPYLRVDVKLKCDVDDTPWCEWYKDCLRGFYRAKPEHKVCSVCTWKCWTGFALVGHCTQNSTPKCLKVGRDISEEDAEIWPKGTVEH